MHPRDVRQEIDFSGGNVKRSRTYQEMLDQSDKAPSNATIALTIFKICLALIPLAILANYFTGILILIKRDTDRNDANNPQTE